MVRLLSCRVSLDLRSLTVDKTHDLTVDLEDEAGSLRLLVTVTGAVSSTDHEVSPTLRQEITQRYVSLGLATPLVEDVLVCHVLTYIFFAASH